MDILKNIVATVDPVGIAIYVTVMAFFLGTVAFGRLRDDDVAARKARRWHNHREP
jgi:hypothetical protein